VITLDLPSPEALEGASLAFNAALAGIGLLIVGSAVTAATWARSLNGWALGGVSFVLSQSAQVVTLLFFGPLIAAFTSAPLQEASRAIILSTAARGVRDERQSAAFGFGHGAIDLLTSSLIPTLSAVVILAGIKDGSIFIGQTAEVTEKVRAVAVFLASQTFADAALLLLQGGLLLGLHALLTAIVLRVVAAGGGVRVVCSGLIMPIAVHTPVSVVRTLFPTATMPVLLVALFVAALIYRRGRSTTVEVTPKQ
jgi:hypothetical protein